MFLLLYSLKKYLFIYFFYSFFLEKYKSRYFVLIIITYLIIYLLINFIGLRCSNAALKIHLIFTKKAININVYVNMKVHSTKQ